jgi:hypothetical protein
LLYTKFDYNISFQTLVIVWKQIFYFSNDDLDPKGSKSNTNLGLHMRLLYTKFDYNTSFQTLVIVRKPWCGWTKGSTYKLTPIYPAKLCLWGYNYGTL